MMSDFRRCRCCGLADSRTSRPFAVVETASGLTFPLCPACQARPVKDRHHDPRYMNAAERDALCAAAIGLPVEPVYIAGLAAESVA